MRLSSLKTLFITLLLFAVSATGFARSVDAQKFEVLPVDYWRGYQVNLLAMDSHDTICSQLPPGETIFWQTPHSNMKRGSADSIGVWCELPAGSQLIIGTAIDHNNERVNSATSTLNGPLDYGCYWVPFELDSVGIHSSANYVIVTQEVGYSNVDAAELAFPGDLSVENSTAVENRKVRWFTLPRIEEVFYGTLEEAVRSLPKSALYITSDGKQYVLGK
jgi:hypothetical protein